MKVTDTKFIEIAFSLAIKQHKSNYQREYRLVNASYTIEDIF